jgi:hypothetical protein
MPISERTPDHHPRMWPSLLTAGILAVVVPFVWLASQADPFGWWLVFLPYLIPPAFGVFWPALLALQSLMGSGRRPWLARHTTAVILFVLSGTFWVWLIKGEVRSAGEEKGAKVKQQEVDQQRVQQQEVARLAAQDALAAGGPLAFTEPLKPAESHAIALYIYSHRDIPPADLLEMSKRYHDPGIMRELAGSKACPPEALSIILENALEQRNASPSFSSDIDETMYRVARNANTPPEILGKMLKLKDANARELAVESPRVPTAEKIAYLRTWCESFPMQFHTQSEGRFVASATDTPPEVLECLATQPLIRYFVAANPHTPVGLLQRLIQSDAEAATKKAAQENIDRRVANEK